MPKNELERNITLGVALSTLVGSVIGAGIFFKPTAVFSATGSGWLGILAWIIAGVTVIAGGLTVAELGVLFPQTGGIIVYLEKAFGELVAFLAGWVQMTVYFPANMAALSIIFATQFISLFEVDGAFLIPVAIVTLTFIILINFLGTRYSGRLQSVFTILKFLPVIIITVAGLWYQSGSSLVVHLFPAETNGQGSLFTQLGSGVLATLFAYDGWLNIGTLAGEMKNPKRDLPKVVTIGLGIVMITYVVINLAYLTVAAPSELAATTTPAALVANRLFPGVGGRIITIGILVSVFGGLNGYTMSAIRIPYVMAKRQWLPYSHKLGRIHRHTYVPVASGLVVFAIAILMMFSGSFDGLTNLLVFSIWIFTVLTFVTVFIFRKKYPEERSYKVPLYPIVPLIAIAGGSFVVLNSIITETINSLLGGVLTLAGLPVYWYAKKKIQKKS